MASTTPTNGIPTQTAAQQAAAFAAAGLNSAQQAAVKSGTPVGNTPQTQEQNFSALGNGGNAPSAPTAPAAPVAATAPSATSTVAGVGGAAGAATFNGNSDQSGAGYNTQNTYTATDASGAQFTYQVDKDGNITNKQYARSPLTPDAKFSAATSALAPGAAPTEDDFFAKIQSQLQPLFDQINGAESAAETAANVDATKQTSAANFSNNAQGTAGSSEANSTASAIDQSKAAAIAQAKQTQTAALSTAYQFLTSEAWSAFQDARDNNQTLSKDYVAQQQAQATSVINALFASGASPDSLMQSNPLEYQQLLQYFNGDTNAMNAAFVGAAQKSLINNGAPVFSTGTQQVYGQMITNPDGTPGVKYTTVNLPANLPQNYKVTSYSQAANGQIAYVAFPVDANGNQTVDPTKPNNGVISGFLGGTNTASQPTVPDPTSTAITAQTGLSINAFNFLTQGTSALSRMSTAQRSQVQSEAEDWANKNGIDLSTFQSEYAAYNSTLSGNIQRNNAATIQENELTGTVGNLKDTIDESDFNSLKPENVAKILAGQTVNDPVATKYSTQLLQLQSELAGYNAAIRGSLTAAGGANSEQSDIDEANKIIASGMAQGSLEGFQEAIEASQSKMKGVLDKSINDAQQNVWNLFGVGQNYASAYADGPNNGSGTNKTVVPPNSTTDISAPSSWPGF